MADDTNKDEQKTERFNMFMSPSEMKAIEDWAWENRIRSKSEAVRRLCYLGLLLDRKLPKLLRKLLDQSRQRESSSVTAANIAAVEFELSVISEISAIISEANVAKLYRLGEALDLAGQLREHLEKAGMETEEGRKELVRILRAIGSSSEKKSDDVDKGGDE